MALNNCTPDNVYGPPEHTLFLGCSVVDFEASAGFSEQVTQVTIRLARDDCLANAARPKVYYDSNLVRSTTTEADPGFMGETIPIVGCPVYFRVGDFEFAGLVQSWERENSSNINPGYVVTLIAPTRVLENTSLIIGEYAGPVKDPSQLFSQSISNLINIYGFAEGIGGISCPLISQTSPGVYELGDLGIDGGVFGTPAGGFGGAGVNDNGISWSTMLPIINVLTSAIPRITNNWSPHGRLIHKGANLALYGSPWTNGYGLISADGIHNGSYISEYYLDISELPVPPTYFRFSGVSINLLEAITRVCQESGFEYFLELLTIRGSILAGGGVAKIIKIRGLNKIIQPALTGISAFIADKESDGTLEASSIGRELRDDITSTFLIGGPKQTIYQAEESLDPEGDGDPEFPEDDDTILPYFGTDIDGNMLVPYLIDSVITSTSETGIVSTSIQLWEFEADTTAINLGLEELALVNPIRINERELQNSISIDAWESYIKLALTDSFRSISGELPNAGLDSEQLARLVANSPVSNLAPRDLIAWDTAYTDIKLLLQKKRTTDKEKIYQWISHFANEFYGKKCAIRVPYACAFIEGESLQTTYSEQPTNDGGWTEAATVIGLPNQTFYTDFFSNNQNKIEPFVRFNNASNYDISQFGPGDYIILDDDLYIRASVEEDYVFHDIETQFIPRVVVSVPAIVQESENGEDTTFARTQVVKQQFNDWLFNISGEIPSTLLPDEKIGAAHKIAEMYGNIAAQHIYNAFGRLVYYPNAACIPIKSNVNNYGPWLSVGPAGGIRVEKNDGLVPWQFGDYSTLNTAAQALADAGNVNTQVGELGSITVAGYPELPLGAEINSLAALGGQQLVENRSPLFGNFNGTFVGGSPFSYNYLRYSYGFSLDGSRGPSVGNISISIGTDKISTTYNMRSYTPSFGRFAQLNAQRLSQIGQQRMAHNRDLRSFLFQREAINNKSSIGSSAENKFNSIKTQAQVLRKVDMGLTPHEMLVGQNLPWTTGAGGIPLTSRSIVATESIRDAIAEMSSGAYKNKAFMSLDGLIRPVSLGGDGGLPRLTIPAGNTGGGSLLTYIGGIDGTISGTQSGTVSYDTYDFNPLANPIGYAFSDLSSQHTGTAGHDIEILGRGTGVPEGGMILKHGPTGGGIGYDYRNDYRFMAWKGPVLIHGWGRDTNNKPIPNQVDTESATSGGNFQTTGLSENYLANWLQKPHTWPMGPLNVRWNHATSMWEPVSTVSEKYCKILGHLGHDNGVRMVVLESGSYFYDVSGNITGYTIISGFSNTYNLYASGCELNFYLNSDRNRYEVKNDSELAILVKDSIEAATWNSEASGFVPKRFIAYPLQPYFVTGTGVGFTGLINSGGIISYGTGLAITGWNRYTEAFTVSAGTAYAGQMRNGWLEGLECNSITL